MTWTFQDKLRLISELCADSRLSDAQARCAVAMLARFHNTTTGECFPSYRALAEASAASKPTAKRATAKLKALGVIDFERSNGGRNRVNRYHFKTVSPADPLDGEMVSPADPGGITSGPARVSPTDPRITSEFNLKKRSALSELECVLDREHAEAVIEHRRSMKKPLSARAAMLLAKQFAKCPDANAAADAMIENGWHGFRPGWIQRLESQQAPPAANGSGRVTIRRGSAEWEDWQRHANRISDYALQGRLKYAGDTVEVSSRWPPR